MSEAASCTKPRLETGMSFLCSSLSIRMPWWEGTMSGDNYSAWSLILDRPFDFETNVSLQRGQSVMFLSYLMIFFIGVDPVDSSYLIISL